jgi:hypothetical protein
VDQILGPPKGPSDNDSLTVDPFGLSRKVTTIILTDAPDRRIRAAEYRPTDDARPVHNDWFWCPFESGRRWRPAMQVWRNRVPVQVGVPVLRPRPTVAAGGVERSALLGQQIIAAWKDSLARLPPKNPRCRHHHA